MRLTDAVLTRRPSDLTPARRGHRRNGVLAPTCCKHHPFERTVCIGTFHSQLLTYLNRNERRKAATKGRSQRAFRRQKKGTHVQKDEDTSGENFALASLLRQRLMYSLGSDDTSVRAHHYHHILAQVFHELRQLGADIAWHLRTSTWSVAWYRKWAGILQLQTGSSQAESAWGLCQEPRMKKVVGWGEIAMTADYNKRRSLD